MSVSPSASLSLSLSLSLSPLVVTPKAAGERVGGGADEPAKGSVGEREREREVGVDVE
jgi:hypothetical protein